MRRGRWTYHPDLQFWSARGSAWSLEDTGWWLRKRTGATNSLSWCSYCWTAPYGWWQLYRCPPGEWLIRTPPRPYPGWMYRELGQLFAWPPDWQPGHGICTHRRSMADAMKETEKVYDAQILKALADIGSGKVRERGMT